MHISFLDIAIMVLYLVFTLFIGYYVSKKVNGFEDFALGGRSFGPFALAATFGATNFSTWSMVGKPGGCVQFRYLCCVDCIECLCLCIGSGRVCTYLS